MVAIADAWTERDIWQTAGKAVASGQRDNRDTPIGRCPVRPGLCPSFAGHLRDICPGCPACPGGVGGLNCNRRWKAWWEG